MQVKAVLMRRIDIFIQIHKASMPIKITVPFSEKEDAKKIGAWWFAEEKTWVIPDVIQEINPFLKWLPEKEGYIVKPPYIVAETKRICWACNNNTPLIALGAKSFYSLEYEYADKPVWAQREEDPVLFQNIDMLDEFISGLLQKDFPFFKYTYSKFARESYWANTCVACGVLQGDNYLFDEPGAPYFPLSPEAAKEINIRYINAKFDYYLQASISYGEVYDWFVK
jgi:hypothetical protein